MAAYNDELKVYRGDDYEISEHIKIHQPTLDEICTYGEREYYAMVYMLTATPQSLKWQLWDALGVDYTTISPYELFYKILHNLFSKEQTSILFGSLDLTKYEIVKDEKGELTMYQKLQREPPAPKSKLLNGMRNVLKKVKNMFGKKQRIDNETRYSDSFIYEDDYNRIVDYLRESHGIIKDEKIPANESTKMILIEDARDEFLMSQGKEWHSNLKNMVSAMVNSPGFKYAHSEVWGMKINAFTDSVKRISKIKNVDLLLQSGYSGFGINLRDISNKQIDWLGGLE